MIRMKNDRGRRTRGSAVPSLRFLMVMLSIAIPACMQSSVAGAQSARPAVVTSVQGAGNPSASASAADMGELTDQPIRAGDTVHISVFGAPDFSLVSKVSETGDVPYPFLGSIHVAGLDSRAAAELIAAKLTEQQLVVSPHVLVTIDGATNSITVLGEVRTPGIYALTGKRQLSDLIAAAGGLTANTGRVVEISNERSGTSKQYLAWDPTMHNTANYDRTLSPGDRILVRSCGIAYVGGHVAKPGAYSLCGSSTITLSELIALAGGTVPMTSEKHTYIIRAQESGARTVQEVNLSKILHAKAADPLVKEDDIIYVSPSPLKSAMNQTAIAALTIVGPLLYIYHP